MRDEGFETLLSFSVCSRWGEGSFSEEAGRAVYQALW